MKDSKEINGGSEDMNNKVINGETALGKNMKEITPVDVSYIETHGMSVQDISDRLDVINKPQKFVNIIGALSGSSVLDISDRFKELVQSFDQNSHMYDLPQKFTPASGAASRMFKFMNQYLAGKTSPEIEEKINKLINGLDEGNSEPKFPFLNMLKDILKENGLDLAELIAKKRHLTICEYILDSKYLNFKNLPKALIPFHMRNGRAILPIEEHMIEANAYAGGKLEFTVSPSDKKLFETAIARIKKENPSLEDVQVSLSVQNPKTDSVAVNVRDNKIVRDKEGNIAFFPAGHGSLIENVSNTASIVRNIDNIPVGQMALNSIINYHKAFIVILHDLKSNIEGLLKHIRKGTVNEDQMDNLVRKLEENKVGFHFTKSDYLKMDFDQKKNLLLEELNRPLRVVGVVVNQGEPGGGPMFIEYNRSVIPSIVEKDEISKNQMYFMHEGEFFNPVDMYVSPYDMDGNLVDFRDYVNDERVFIVEKDYNGENVRRMEHPGLWNGAMDGYNSVFVKMTIETFAPVKEVIDLLRTQHQQH